MSTKDLIDKASKEYGTGGSDMFQFKKSGKYTIRLLTDPAPIATHFLGKGQGAYVCFGKDKGCPFHKDTDKAPSLKFMVYLVDRSDGKVKLGELPYSVIAKVADYEEDEDYAFEAYPMPYDIKVTFDKENSDPKQIYKVLASPKKADLKEEETTALSESMEKLTPADYVEKRKAKALAKFKEGSDSDYPENDMNPEDIDFEPPQ
jgi:hypothetical protein